LGSFYLILYKSQNGDRENAAVR